MENPKLEIRALPTDYDHLKHRNVNNIHAEHLAERLKRNLELLHSKWSNSSTKPLNEGTRRFYKKKLEGIIKDRVLLNSSMLQVQSTDESPNLLETLSMRTVP